MAKEDGADKTDQAQATVLPGFEQQLGLPTVRNPLLSIIGSEGRKSKKKGPPTPPEQRKKMRQDRGHGVQQL